MNQFQLKASLFGSLLFTSALALLACTAQTATSNNRTSVNNGSSADPPAVAFCELVDKPGLYDGHVVSTQAIVAVGFEVAIVYDPKCGDREKRAWYDFDQSTYNPEEKGWKSLRSLLFPESKQDSGHYRGRAKTTMVGRFDSSEKNGYGHLNQYHFRFTIIRVDKAEAVPRDLPD